MKEESYFTIGEFSKKTGTTIRTLHYYDQIGLLKPKKILVLDTDYTLLMMY